jgi:ubiquinone/menaquinone biosynthesis C-methylase UbiE
MDEGQSEGDREVFLQRRYYAQTAAGYDSAHVLRDDEHSFALAWLGACIRHYGWRSLLDVGSGTGRVLFYLAGEFPEVDAVGVEPSEDLRAVAQEKGIPREKLRPGDGYALDFEDASFDVVCEFGVLHHVRYPRRVLAEMLRVARRAVFVSDDNHFAAGSRVS